MIPRIPYNFLVFHIFPKANVTYHEMVHRHETHIQVGKYLWNSLDKTVFMAKPLLTEFGIQHILESCALVLVRLKTQCLNIAMIGVAQPDPYPLVPSQSIPLPTQTSHPSPTHLSTGSRTPILVPALTRLGHCHNIFHYFFLVHPECFFQCEIMSLNLQSKGHVY